MCEAYATDPNTRLLTAAPHTAVAREGEQIIARKHRLTNQKPTERLAQLAALGAPVPGGRKAMRAQEGAAACVPTSGTRGKAAPRAGAGLVDLAFASKVQTSLLTTERRTSSYV